MSFDKDAARGWSKMKGPDFDALSRSLLIEALDRIDELEAKLRESAEACFEMGQVAMAIKTELPSPICPSCGTRPAINLCWSCQ